MGTGAIVNIYDASSRLISGKPDSVGSSETTVDYITGDDSTFASDTGFWTKTDASVSITGGVCRCVNTPGLQGIKRIGAAKPVANGQGGNGSESVLDDGGLQEVASTGGGGGEI